VRLPAHCGLAVEVLREERGCAVVRFTGVGKWGLTEEEVCSHDGHC